MQSCWGIVVPILVLPNPLWLTLIVRHSLSEFNKLIGQSHQFVLDLRILAPGCNLQKLYHDPFQARALLGGQPASGSGLTSACHTHSTAAILAVVFSP
jgi:hypothetical protein